MLRKWSDILKNIIDHTRHFRLMEIFISVFLMLKKKAPLENTKQRYLINAVQL